jgi:hypothetical protein
MIQAVATPKKAVKKIDGRASRRGAHSPEDIASLAKKLRNTASKLEAIAYAMRENEIADVTADGASMAERGLTHLNNFAGHLIRTLTSNPNVEFNFGKVE